MNFEVQDEEQEHAPDNVLSSVRGRWRMPSALTEEDFLRTFQAVDPSNTFASVLERLKQGEWRYPTSFAKAFNRTANWAMSVKYFLKRAGYIQTHDDFYNYFPARRSPKP